MPRLLLLLAALIASPLQAAEQCVWPFRAAPAEVAAALRADMKAELQTLCPARTEIAVTFLLKPQGQMKRVAVSSPHCPKAEARLRRWFAGRPSSDFLTFAVDQDVAFKIVTRFAA